MEGILIVFRPVLFLLSFQSLLSAQSIRERETKKVGEEIMELLSKPTAKEQSIAQRFRSQGGKGLGMYKCNVMIVIKKMVPIEIKRYAEFMYIEKKNCEVM